ncbi:MAG TPA: efflux RND transporter periplasmic adaptor subunit [Chloroflexota bacterium]|nr:efflux RND transporter periplasmic adaptor subunit [Chloroflexota bacterium]
MRKLWDACLRQRKRLALVLIAVLLVGGALGALQLWHEATYFVTTENAAIAGALVQVSSPDAGRIFRLQSEVGSLVRKDDALVTLDVPITTAMPLGGTRSTFLDAHDRMVDVVSPVDGVVVSRKVNVGDNVNTNQTLFTVVDTRRLWVVANVEETRVAHVRPGQYVEVYVDALDRTLEGIVEAIIPATTSTFALLPQQNTAGSFTKIVQLVPVRIGLRNADDARLIVGASARVRIHLAGQADAR